MKYNHTNRISLSCYEYAFRTWPLYEWSVKVSTTHSTVEISKKPPPFPPTHIHRDNTALLSLSLALWGTVNLYCETLSLELWGTVNLYCETS